MILNFDKGNNNKMWNCEANEEGFSRFEGDERRGEENDKGNSTRET